MDVKLPTSEPWLHSIPQQLVSTATALSTPERPASPLDQDSPMTRGTPPSGKAAAEVYKPPHSFVIVIFQNLMIVQNCLESSWFPQLQKHDARRREEVRCQDGAYLEEE
jgi:hypothetical protein